MVAAAALSIEKQKQLRRSSLLCRNREKKFYLYKDSEAMMSCNFTVVKMNSYLQKTVVFLFI
jgi:hypothetical protein